MLKVQRRIAHLECAMGVSDRLEPLVHHIRFVDGDGTVEGTLVITHQHFTWQPGKHFRNRRDAR